MSYFHKAWILHEHSESLNLLFFFCAAAIGVHRNSLAESGIFSGISLAYLSTALKNRSDEKR